MSRIAFAIVMLSAAVAAAEPATKVFPLTGQRMARSKRELPELLTRTVAKSLNGTVAGLSIEDTADTLTCKLPQTTCLKEVAKSAGTQRIVYGVVVARPEGGFTVRLSTFDKDNQDERTYVLTGETNDALAAQLARVLGGQDDEPVEVVKPVRTKRNPAVPVPTPTPTPVPTPTPTPTDDEPQSGGITTGTWAMIIGGGVTAVAGGGLYISGGQLKKEAAGLPKNDLTDFNNLKKYESAAALRMNIGAGLAIAGTALAVIGVVRALSQKGSGKESPTLAIAPESGGASVFYARSW